MVEAQSCFEGNENVTVFAKMDGGGCSKTQFRIDDGAPIVRQKPHAHFANAAQYKLSAEEKEVAKSAMATLKEKLCRIAEMRDIELFYGVFEDGTHFRSECRTIYRKLHLDKIRYRKTDCRYRNTNAPCATCEKLFAFVNPDDA